MHRRFLLKVLTWMRLGPWLSTVLAAVFLGFAWTVLWLLVFFAATWLLDVRTPVEAFLLTFWLTVFVEAILRALENVDTVVRLSQPLNPTARGDDGHKFRHAAYVFLVGMFLLGLYYALAFYVHDVFALDRTLEFGGQDGDRTSSGFFAMLSNNWRILNEYGVLTPLCVGTFFRIIIYKQKHRAPSATPTEQGMDRNG